MYGTVALMRVKPGMDSALLALSEEYRALKVPGMVGEYVYRTDADANQFYMVVMFESKKAYFANAESPEQDARYRRMRECLQADPEWHDGEVVLAFP